MASPTQWTWVWVLSRSWWWRAAVHGVAKSQIRLSNWTELNWCVCFHHTNLIQRLLFTTFNLKFPFPQLIKWHFPPLETGFHRLIFLPKPLNLKHSMTSQCVIFKCYALAFNTPQDQIPYSSEALPLTTTFIQETIQHFSLVIIFPISVWLSSLFSELTKFWEPSPFTIGFKAFFPPQTQSQLEAAFPSLHPNDNLPCLCQDTNCTLALMTAHSTVVF